MWESESVFQPKKTFTHQTLLDARAHLQRVGLPRREEGGDAEDDVVALKKKRIYAFSHTFYTKNVLPASCRTPRTRLAPPPRSPCRSRGG